MKKVVHYFKNKFIIAAISIIVVIIIASLFGNGSGKPAETAEAKIGQVIETVSVTGKVAAFQKADLGFEKGGVISKINVKVGDIVKAGDILASLDSADGYASLQGAQANFLAEQARLAELQKGLRPEEVTVEDAKLEDASSDFEDARIGLINGFHDSYVKTEDALFNYADNLFDYPQSVLPRINIRTDNSSTQKEINDLRFLVSKDLKKWKSYLDSVSTSTDPTAYVDSIKLYLEDVKKFLSLLSEIVSDLGTSNSGLSQSEIDAHISRVNASMSAFTDAVTSFSSTEASYRSMASGLSLAQQESALKKAGASPEALQIQQAKVSQASASVLGYRAELAKKQIISPIAGVVSKAEPQLGEFVAAGDIVFGVIGDQSYKVEINVPEVDIVKISVGNPSDITLDAYDENTVFKGSVIGIDPAETIVEGIPTYKVTLQFDSKDDRVRSGMTANIDIITQSKDGVLTIPTRALIDKEGKKFVRVLADADSSDYAEVPVVIGIRGSNGMVEILSGLSAGDTVITLLK